MEIVLAALRLRFGAADPMIAMPSGPVTFKCPREVSTTSPPAALIAEMSSRHSLVFAFLPGVRRFCRMSQF